MPRHVSLTLTVNGAPVDVAFAPYKTLLEVLREDLNLCGTKHGCELGECGACAVLLDGQPVLSCLVLGLECEGREVTTVEGLARDNRLHPLQDTFADLGAAQCGYCTPGILVTAKALLDEHPRPTREQIKEALSGNLCRCTGYQQIFEAVEAALRLARPEPVVLREPQDDREPRRRVEGRARSGQAMAQAHAEHAQYAEKSGSANSASSARDVVGASALSEPAGQHAEHKRVEGQ